MKTIVLSIFISLLLLGCEQTKSVEYYQNHPQEARERSLECKNKSIISQDCINAYKVGFPKDQFDDEDNIIP
ncbi:hypothetical protein DZC71_00915 [Campylobacter hepaticus]|uniref:EexN family lipoprotein n=1 Tax=Campylobacter hepaticus TaxID=1813019 RepID=A0A424Z140_9BACT|nr:EexN family lipoprotein [Campylobacter hepaticus]RQD68942.1 hypothetical protein DZC71_00915 [Campylobacter hepaticus]RQD87901.1 hypothetical protein DZD40_03080 [Campylobacter hepaticus]